ncbi:MAG TPA: imidazolonepropionase [Azospirillaceae bacterium]|nr:imidazolonepropionase [Azospirillaceae bacterium]
MTAMFDSLWVNAHLATMREGGAPYGAIPDGALGIKAGRIAWVGPAADLPAAPATLAPRVEDCCGGWITPGLIDCHTHLVYGGSRAAEFEMRLQGVDYAEIARRGGGIVSTVRATRALDENGLLTAALKRARALMADGVTTIEVKSGYGLSLEDELKSLRVVSRLGRTVPMEVVPTLLAAHAVPPEHRDDPDGYVEEICQRIVPAAADANLAEAVDVFCETIAFSPAQCDRVFAAARAAGLAVKCHAEQLSNQGGAALAARHGALSADHLEHLDEAGIAAMAAAGTVAVLLPGAYYFLRDAHPPPVAGLRAAGVPIAIATDHNPGTSPFVSLRLMLNMACILFRLTPEEALAGVTRNAARALGRAESIGTLDVGKRADFVLWDISGPAELAYQFGVNPLRRRVFAGVTSHA